MWSAHTHDSQWALFPRRLLVFTIILYHYGVCSSFHFFFRDSRRHSPKYLAISSFLNFTSLSCNLEILSQRRLYSRQLSKHPLKTVAPKLSFISRLINAEWHPSWLHITLCPLRLVIHTELYFLDRSPFSACNIKMSSAFLNGQIWPANPMHPWL